MDRVNFKKFNDRYYKTPVSCIGNIPQYKEISEDEISFKLYEYDEGHWVSLWIIPYKYVPESNKEIGLVSITGEGTEHEKISDYKTEKLNGKKAVIKFTLTENGVLENMLKKERKKYLQLYFNVKYGPGVVKESVDLPHNDDLYLRIKRIDGEIIFQSASQLHSLPMMFDTNTGDPYYIEARQKITKGGLYANKMKTLLLPPDVDGLTKKSYEFALRRLKAGELVFNDGSVGKNSRLYEYTIRNIDDTFSEKIVMGVNKGTFVKGVTSKGINQLEAFSNIGKAGAAKFIGKVMPLFSAAMDLSNMVVAVGNGEKPPIPFMPPFVTWEVEKICNDIAEFEYELFFKSLNNVLFSKIDDTRKGIIAVEIFIEQWNNQNPHAKYNWEVVRLTQSTLENLLNGEIKRKEYISDLTYEGGNEERNCGILVFTNYEDDEQGREVPKHYIYSIFLPEIIE